MKIDCKTLSCLTVSMAIFTVHMDAVPVEQALEIKNQCTVIKRMMHGLNDGFELLLDKGDAQAYEKILNSISVLEKIEQKAGYDQQLTNIFNDMVSMINNQVLAIARFVKSKPAQPDMNYVNQFKNEIDLIGLMDLSSKELQLVSQKLLQKGHKHEAVVVHMISGDITKIRQKWDEKIKKNSLVMISNLYNSMKN
ncbi:hypothetical protein IPH25_01575 [bacterium]|nr:MAG: hypothetical protein IPG37_03705 [bacterium]QQR62116.1 MAG: hypothetical protein IPH25_01575 [bacterium]QQR63325.1 MAG: hypothetical protein IPH67_02535 [bacterium]